MNTFLIAAVAFGLAMLGMAVGVIFGKRRLRGSCGGIANLRDSQGNVLCDSCTTPSSDCAGPDADNASPVDSDTEVLHAADDTVSDRSPVDQPAR